MSLPFQVIHGLDQVIYYYRRNPNTGLQHSLGDFVEGELCPNALRLHGSENLLHRATAGGNAIVVSELLNCGYRNLSAKNHDGQSAVHLGNPLMSTVHSFVPRFVPCCHDPLHPLLPKITHCSQFLRARRSIKSPHSPWCICQLHRLIRILSLALVMI